MFALHARVLAADDYNPGQLYTCVSFTGSDGTYQQQNGIDMTVYEARNSVRPSVVTPHGS